MLGEGIGVPALLCKLDLDPCSKDSLVNWIPDPDFFSSLLEFTFCTDTEGVGGFSEKMKEVAVNYGFN